MTDDISRRDFLAATATLAAGSQLPIGAIANPAQAAPAKGTVIVFQGDSITDSGRNRESADPNAAGALGNGYPLLVASAVLAARPASEFRFYNRGISGNKVPDDETRKALPRVHLIVLEPFVLRTGAVDARWFPEFDQRRAAAARVATHARATFVPLQSIFDQRVRTAPAAYWAADGVHPTPAGHAVIAAEWRRAARL
ncbi:MAG: lysophospholipase [Gemmatimonadetes bacterium]|nr:MAG: lysophospholipase [Gemmatimonadota bacterium]